MTASSSEKIWVIPSVLPPSRLFVTVWPEKPCVENATSSVLPSARASSARLPMTTCLSSPYFEGSDRSAFRLAKG